MNTTDYSAVVYEGSAAQPELDGQHEEPFQVATRGFKFKAEKVR